jgi:hypothetical protein
MSFFGKSGLKVGVIEDYSKKHNKKSPALAYAGLFLLQEIIP